MTVAATSIASDKGLSLRSDNGDARRYLRQHLTKTHDRVAVDGMILREVHRVEEMVAEPADLLARNVLVELQTKVEALEAALAKLLSLPGIQAQVETQERFHAKSSKKRDAFRNKGQAQAQGPEGAIES